MDSLDESSLIIFDIDHVLTSEDDLVFQPQFSKQRYILLKKILGTSDRREVFYFYMKLVLHAKKNLVDKNTPFLIRDLQKKGIKVIALTARGARPFGCVSNMADQSVKGLNELGIDFSFAFPQNTYLCLSDSLNSKTSFPVFRKGIIFTEAYDKGYVLEKFLSKMNWRPKKIIFVDDDMKNIKSVRASMKRVGVDFVGLHYLGCGYSEDAFDWKLAEFQTRHFMEHEEWLSDEMARRAMGKNEDSLYDIAA